MKLGRRATGIQGEDQACSELVRRGYTIVERGWRCARGEIDIVARVGECWAFVEVKTRHGQRAGMPEEALNKRKWMRIAELAETYLGEHELSEVNWRIDLVAIELTPDNLVKRLNLVQGTTSP
ncbi:MAG: YraN family protein [Anaerolineae bacterium]